MLSFHSTVRSPFVQSTSAFSVRECLVFVNSGFSIALWLAVVPGCAALFSPLISRQRHRKEFRVRHGWLTVLTRRYIYLDGK